MRPEIAFVVFGAFLLFAVIVPACIYDKLLRTRSDLITAARCQDDLWDRYNVALWDLDFEKRASGDLRRINKDLESKVAGYSRAEEYWREEFVRVDVALHNCRKSLEDANNRGDDFSNVVQKRISRMSADFENLQDLLRQKDLKIESLESGVDQQIQELESELSVVRAISTRFSDSLDTAVRDRDYFHSVAQSTEEDLQQRNIRIKSLEETIQSIKETVTSFSQQIYFQLPVPK